MTRKRLIKLLMGNNILDRNHANIYADIAVLARKSHEVAWRIIRNINKGDT